MEAKFKYCEIGLGPTADRLNGQERATVLLLAMGKVNKEIAKQTQRSAASVKKTVDGLIATFGVTNRGAVIAQAFCHRVLVSADEVQQ